MRSLWYRLTKTPKNLADCLDLAHKKPIEQASLRLRFHELIREQWLGTQLLARFEMKYAGETHVVEKLCGGYLDSYSNGKKRTEIDRANAKLKDLTTKLRESGIMLSGYNQRFEYEPSPKTTISNPYEIFAQTELILRDQLAIDRTILANERTFLAYCRTSLALIITGAGSIKLFDILFSDIAGWALIASGAVVAVMGAWRSAIMARNIKSAGRHLQDHPNSIASHNPEEKGSN